MHDVDDYPGAQTVPGLIVYRYDAPLSFASAQDFRRRPLAAAGAATPLRWFGLNVEANVEADFAARPRRGHRAPAAPATRMTPGSSPAAPPANGDLCR